MSSNFRWRQVLILAGAYIATIIGSGFATGQEIMQFFVAFGGWGFLGVAISFVCFAYVGAEILNRARILRLYEPIKVYQFYCGKYMAKFLEYFVPLFLFGTYLIMVAGAGAAVSEYFHVNPYIGRIGMSLLAWATVLLGLKKLANVLGHIGPVLIVLALALGIISLVGHIDTFAESLRLAPTLDIPKAGPHIVICGLLYTCFNMFVVGGLLAGLGPECRSRKEAWAGGIIGGLALGLGACVMYAALLAQVAETSQYEVPSLFLANQVNPILANVFTVVLMLGIYTTATPLLWQVTNRVVPDDHRYFKLVVTIVAVLGFVCALLPFKTLINTIYPLGGWLGLVVMILMIVKGVILRKRGSDGSDEMTEHRMDAVVDDAAQSAPREQ